MWVHGVPRFSNLALNPMDTVTNFNRKQQVLNES